MKSKENLLDFIAYILGCTFLSDLKSEPYNSRAKVLLQNMKLRKYSWKEIADAIQYLYFKNQFTKDVK